MGSMNQAAKNAKNSWLKLEDKITSTLRFTLGLSAQRSL
jgi:hypothetical protein